MNTLFRSVSVVLAGRATRIALILVFTPILVRVLTQAEYGAFAYLLAIAGVVTVISPLGLFDSVRKHVAEHEAGSDAEARIVAAAAALSGLYAIVLAVSLLAVTRRLTIVPEWFVAVLLVVVLSNNLFQIARGVFYGRRREQPAEIASTVRKTIYVALGLALAYLGFGVAGVLAAYAVALAVVAVALGGLAASSTSTRLAIDLSTLDTVGRYGLVQAVGGIAAVLLYKTDILLVEYFTDASRTALYQAALLPAEYVWFVPSAIQVALLQNASHHWARDELDTIDRNARRGLKYAALSLVLFGVGLFVLADDFLAVYFGPDYAASAMPLRILLIGTLFFGVTRVLVPVLQATGRLRYTEGLTVLALGVNVVCNVVLIPRYGIEGAAIGTAISYVFVFVGGVFVWTRTEFSLLGRGELLRFGGLLVVFTAAFWLLVRGVALSPVYAMLAFPVVGFGLFLAVALLFGLVTLDELRRVTNSVTRKSR